MVIMMNKKLLAVAIAYFSHGGLVVSLWGKQDKAHMSKYAYTSVGVLLVLLEALRRKMDFTKFGDTDYDLLCV